MRTVKAKAAKADRVDASNPFDAEREALPKAGADLAQGPRDERDPSDERIDDESLVVAGTPPQRGQRA